MRKVNLTRSRFSEEFLLTGGVQRHSLLCHSLVGTSLSVRVKQHLHWYRGINIETSVGRFFNFVIVAISGFLKSSNWSGEISLMESTKEPPVLSLVL